MLQRERLTKAIILAAALEEEAVSALIAVEIRKLEYMYDDEYGWEEELEMGGLTPCRRRWPESSRPWPSIRP